MGLECDKLHTGCFVPAFVPLSPAGDVERQDLSCLVSLKLTLNTADSKMSPTGRWLSLRFHSNRQDATGQCSQLQSIPGSACRMWFLGPWENSAKQGSVMAPTACRVPWQGLISLSLPK